MNPDSPPKPTRRWRLFALVSVLALMATLLPLSPAGAQNRNSRYVQDLNLYYDSPSGLQPGDYLKWEAPTRNSSNIVNYTVQRQTRTDDRWSSWTTLATVVQSANDTDDVIDNNGIVYDITDTQPACTDWNFRVRANWDNGTTGPWSKAWFILSPRRPPPNPVLDNTKAGTVSDGTNSGSGWLWLTADWEQAYCQTDFEVWYRTRSQGNLGNLGANWSAWMLLDGGPSVGGDGEGSSIGGLPGGTNEYSVQHRFNKRGIGVQFAVAVANRAGWSDYSYIRFTRGFRVTCAHCGWIPITRSDVT